MARAKKFKFRRARGVVWVCDLAQSTMYLNDDKSVEAIEEFLPRLHWFAELVTELAGGKLVSWTGDGFLSWFEFPLHRSLPERTRLVLRAIWEFTLFVNVTQLGVTGTSKKFNVRHGVTYEQDALLTNINYRGGYQTTDLMGRNVVLAFRCSGLPSKFPGIVATKEIVEASKFGGIRGAATHFQQRKVSEKETLQYFKGEKWGTKNLYVTGESKSPKQGTPALIRDIKKTVKGSVPKRTKTNDLRILAFIEEYHREIAAGPQWAKEAGHEFNRWLAQDVLGALKAGVQVLEEAFAASQKKH